MYKILFVCSGSTCRSPMASALLNNKAKKLGIGSLTSHFCGMFVEFGSSVKEESKEALKKYGVKRVCGKPTQITGKHLAEHHLIVCLTEDHKQALSNMVADKFVNKIVCFKDFCGIDIFDPYGGDIGVYDKCLSQIDVGLDCIINTLLGNGIIKQRS